MPSYQDTKGKPGPARNSDPADAVVPVSASDTVNINGDGTPCRGLLVGTAGAADLVDATGTLRSAVPLQQGYNPIRVIRINLTNLGASNIWALS